ncbi:MAG: PfkB family carbohydrate kinase [Bryobacterales bacterium]|nr:PfkB family carbohydrate kinase [Bryobacterales bacterium]MDE0294371.1 PfkB family carbohydrate kinase [Bryobacterales bacterium]
MEARFDIVGVGLNSTDTVLMVSRFPPHGGKTPFTKEVLSPGGQVASAIATCQALGLRTKYIGSIGDDERGRIQLESLQSSGIDLEHLQVRRGCANQSAYIVVDEETGERTIFWRRDDCLRIDPDQIDADQITCARLLHIDGHDTPAVERAASIARKAGIPVTVDVDTIYRGFDRVLPLVDYLVASAEFPARWTGEQNPFRALELLQAEHDMKVTAMTLGSRGALAYAGGRFLYSPAFVVDCVDTTGAGDVFHGAFCYGLLEGYPLEEVLDFSNAMAALNCRALGARGGIAPATEARALMESGERRASRDFSERIAHV